MYLLRSISFCFDVMFKHYVSCHECFMYFRQQNMYIALEMSVVAMLICSLYATNLVNINNLSCDLLEVNSLYWRQNGHDSVTNHQPCDCLLNRLFRRRSKKTSKLRVTGLCVGNSPGTGELPAQRASNAENVSIWWRHHVNPETKSLTEPAWGASHQCKCMEMWSRIHALTSTVILLSRRRR